MPLITVKTSAPALEPPAAQALLLQLSAQLASLLGKPERYVMTALQSDASMTFAGDPAPAAYVEVKSIGALEGDRTRELSGALCSLLQTHLGVPSERVYIGFEDVPGRLWGWNGATFG